MAVARRGYSQSGTMEKIAKIRKWYKVCYNLLLPRAACLTNSQKNGGSNEELTALLDRAIDKRVKELLTEFSHSPETFEGYDTKPLQRWAAANAYVPPPAESDSED